MGRRLAPGGNVPVNREVEREIVTDVVPWNRSDRNVGDTWQRPDLPRGLTVVLHDLGERSSFVHYGHIDSEDMAHIETSPDGFQRKERFHARCGGHHEYEGGGDLDQSEHLQFAIGGAGKPGA